jgi:beta-galactosidase
MTAAFTSHAADLVAPREFAWIADGLAFGGDYNPEQWPEEVWAEDMELMRRAGVNSVNLGVFSWGLLETADGEYDWGWLDRVMALCAENGIGVNLATPTAAPPMWLVTKHPEIMSVDDRGVRTAPGARLGWSPSSAVFRSHAVRFVRVLAERYGSHPALRMWHVSNELGNENDRCYSDETGAAWRVWLEAKFGDIGALNAAWGTAFWGHRYTTFEQVQPPRFARSGHNPSLVLDFERFSSDALLAHYKAERTVLREVTPDIPITTNFMVLGGTRVPDYARWAEEVDLVSNDHYTESASPDRHSELAFSADRTRGVAHGRPWLLIEHSTSAVDWQPINRAKLAGELTRNTLSHIARGADGALFFQWRASTAGSERFHSAVVPHAGVDSKIFREVERLGATLKRLASVVGSRVADARVAILFDHDASIALSSGKKPSSQLDYLDLALAFHRALTSRGIAVDVIRPADGFAGYDVVVVPTLFLATAQTSAALTEFVEAGGHAVVTYFSGIVDETNRVITGGYPGAFRDVLGVSVEEFHPLQADEAITLSNGWAASVWSEQLEVRGASVLATYATGDLAEVPALTRNFAGEGSATYLATRVDHSALLELVDDVCALAGIRPIAEIEEGLEVVRRRSDSASYLFLLNHADAPRTAIATGTDLDSGVLHDGSVTVAAGAVVVLEETP